MRHWHGRVLSRILFLIFLLHNGSSYRTPHTSQKLDRRAWFKRSISLITASTSWIAAPASHAISAIDTNLNPSQAPLNLQPNEQQTIKVFKQASPSVVNIDTFRGSKVSEKVGGGVSMIYV